MGQIVVIPDELRFAVTRKCRGLCRHCYNESGADSDRLSTEDYLRILREVREVNPDLDRLTLTGGEPLEEKARVLAIAAAARGLGLRVRLVTRGWELTPAVCAELRTAGVTRVQIGIDSPAARFRAPEGGEWDSFHSWLRAEPDSLRQALAGIVNAVAAGLSVSVRFSLARSNRFLLADTYALACSLGAAKFKLRLLFPDGKARLSLLRELVNGTEYAQAQRTLIAASKGRNTVVELAQPCLYSLPSRTGLERSRPVHNAYRETCSCGATAAYVDANGDVKYCLFDAAALGNVLPAPFLEVWNSPPAQLARQTRGPLDRCGGSCSAFRILYGQFQDYARFMAENSAEVARGQPN